MFVSRVSRSRARFEEFVEGSTGGLVRIAYLMTGDLGEAEDLVQETFLRVARRWDRVRRLEYPTAYARRVLVNLVIDGQDRRRRRRLELNSTTDGEFETADRVALQPFESVETMSALRSALQELPRQQRAVLVLRYYEDMSESAVAEALGCSVGTVKKTTWRAVQRLRLVLDGSLIPAGSDPATPEQRG